MREHDRRALKDVAEALDVAATRMARVVVETAAPDDVREFVKKQWLRLAKLQVAVEEKLEEPIMPPTMPRTNAARNK
jgi:hypothetical protein